MKNKVILILITMIALSGCTQSSKVSQENLSLPTPATKKVNTMPVSNQDQIKAEKLIIETSKGTIEVKLYQEEAPNTVSNFASKAKSGYFDNLTFHRVEDWVVQGGDPLGTGTGGGQMPTEINSMPYKIGSVGVARGGDIKVSNDSQFFICTKDCSFLNNKYTNFGEVTKGMEVVNKIEIGDKILSMKAK